MKQFYSLCMIMLLASVLAIDVMGQKTTLTVTGKVTDLEGAEVDFKDEPCEDVDSSFGLHRSFSSSSILFFASSSFILRNILLVVLMARSIAVGTTSAPKDEVEATSTFQA